MSIKKGYFRLIASYLAVFIFLAAVIPAKTYAYATESVEVYSSRQEDMNKVQRALESKIVGDKLAELGLTKDEATAKLDKLSDAELHQFAMNADNIEQGGGIIGLVIGLLIIAILIVVLLQLTDHKIQLKKK
ncbi:MAG: PA2779 family protein [Thermodesulfobacteriota bacterium]